MGIEFNFSIKRKITVNGKEYDSLDEVPERERQILQNAIKSGGGLAGNKKLIVNGVGYDSPEDMPPDARRVYEESLGKAKAMAQRTGSSLILPENSSPEGGLSKWAIIAFFLLVGLVLLMKFFMPK